MITHLKNCASTQREQLILNFYSHLDGANCGVHVDGDGNHNECRFGVNLGVGAEFALSRNWAMNLEFKYQLVSDFDQGVINIGAAYRF